jgi:hypothetical protein
MKTIKNILEKLISVKGENLYVIKVSMQGHENNKCMYIENATETMMSETRQHVEGILDI